MRTVRNDGAVHLALFYSSPNLSRAFRSLARSGAISLLTYDLARSSREDWKIGGRPDALILELADGIPLDPALMTRLQKSHPTVPILTFGPSAKREKSLGTSFHLTEVPSAEGIRELVADARRHRETAEKATRTSRRLRETSKRLQILGEIISTANSSLEPGGVVSAIMCQIQKLIPSEAWSILLVDEERKELSFEMALGEKGQLLSDIRLKLGEGIAGWVAQNGKPTIVNNVQRDPRFQKRFDDLTKFITRSILCAPLVSRGRTIGVVEIVNREGEGRFTRRDLKLLLTLVEPAAIALENALLFQKSQRLAITDDLTKLYNSRYLNTYLEEEIIRSTREGSPLALIFLDLDGFKSVNDRFGHLCGSRTLFEAGGIIKQAAEGEELVSRYGGDEFVVVLPTADASAALSTAQRIRHALNNHRFLADRGLTIRISASFGIACFPEHGSTPQDLIQKADQAMYHVKERGKDAVRMAE